MIDNPILNKKENLVINAQDPFGKYNSDDRLLGKVLTGSWYNKAYNNLIMDQNKDFLCPIIAYCDACQISDKSQYGAHSFTITLGIFDRKTWNQPYAWAPLGYIAHPHLKSYQAKPTGKSRGNETWNLQNN